MAAKGKIEVLLTANEGPLVAGLRRGQSGLKAFGASAEREGRKAQSTLSKLASIKLPLAGLAVGGAVAYYANEVRKVADEYTNLESRLRLVTAGESDLAMVRERLYQISQETGTAYAANADAYAKLGRAVRDMGGDSQETLDITEMVSKSLIVNGSSAEMASSFMLQFAQAMGSGVLQGDEFRAMMESNSFFAAELAKALDTDIAGLRKMSKAGLLTTDALRAAFPKMAAAVNTEFGKIAPTVERALKMLENSFKRQVDDSNKASGGTGKVSTSIVGLAQTIDANREGIVSLFSFIIDMAAGATDKIIKLTQTVGNIGQSFSGWDAVFEGKLSFFEFATMNAKDLETWLKKDAEAAKQMAAVATAADNQVAASGKKTAETVKQATGAALEEMKKKYQAYAAEVRRLQDEIAGRERSLASELRELARSGMSDASAWQDQKREAEEYAQAAKRTAEEAKRAMEAGDTVTAQAKWKEAVALTDQAKASYKALNTEVKDGDRVLISQQQALKTAMDGVKASGEQAIEILKQQQEAAKAGMDSLLGESGFADLTAGMDAAEKQWLKNWKDMETEAVDAVETVRKRIDAMVEDRHVTIWVEEKVKKATGGLVHRLATGGKLPGYGGGDRISALLEAGEFVVRKEAVSKFGAGLFHALNSLRLPEIPRFAAGGQVGSGESMTINFAFGGGQPVASLRGNREQAVLLEREFARRAMRSSR
ncbi:MAG: tape measure protein [Rhodocyclaceae bacterium]|jgi:tape measure domain-containing protein|nr:tape measure protein [Rhodocyclaceae bacterium]